jgi:NADH:ubiquinone reductase (H+-translocating)
MAHRVVIVGGGFGGLQAAKKLRRAPVEVTLVDRENYHLFQPLAYQVATGSLGSTEIAVPLRSVFKRQPNVRVVLAEASAFDLDRREVHVRQLPNGDAEEVLPYDSLIVATGSSYSYFGRDEWREHAPELKSLKGALEIRSRILTAFEAAEVEADPARRQAWLTFVVVGAGPTGAEMAGQIAELAHDTRRDFRAADTTQTKVLLVETADRVLTAFDPKLSRKAAGELRSLGVTPLTSHTVVDITAEAVTIRDANGADEVVPARTKVWAAGVTVSGAAGLLGAERDRAGRVTVTEQLTLPGHPEVFVLGDMADVDGRALPGLAPVAMQQGRFAGETIAGRLAGRTPTAPFHYKDKGNLATIGRLRAVGEIGPLKLSGFLAWALWLGVHITYLIGFHNRLVVLLRWSFSFVTHGRAARVITTR